MPNLKSEFKRVVLEAVLVVVFGLALALAANAVSKRGLVLTRDYFPAGTNAPPVAIVSTNQPSAADQLSQRLRQKGLQEIQRAAVETLSNDPRARDGRVIFIDARDEEHYAIGHLPGAYQFDPFHPEKQFGTVFPVCQAAEQVVVYCTGGECEDADTAAILIRDAGVPDKKIFVYGGGFTEWSDHHLPLETGPRSP